MKELVCSICALFLWGCESKSTTSSVAEQSKDSVEKQFVSKPEDAVKSEYTIVEKIKGDLNQDGQADYVFIVKGTQKEYITTENGTTVDNNRRGILVVLQRKNKWEVLVKNYTCLPSLKEKVSVYMNPEISFSIARNNFYVHYSHGRYGYWKYTFRYRKNQMVLIGYDAVDKNGAVIQQEISINFNNKKRLIRTNLRATSSVEESEFREQWDTLPKVPNYVLDKISDFDTLDRELE